MTIPSFSQIRPAVNAGRFYGANPTALKEEIDGYYSHCNDIKPRPNLAAVIVPHAGYVFSAQTATKAFACIDTTQHYDHIFLLGPSHYVWLGGASVNTHNDAYATPFGNVEVDQKIGEELCKQNRLFKYNPQAHSREHCLEVQLPLLQVRLSNNMPPIVPIIISDNNVNDLQSMAETLRPYFNEHNLFVISSDFSHYPRYEDANRIDSATCNAILSGKPDVFLRQLQHNDSLGIHNLETSACGEFAIMTLLYMIDSHYKLSKIDYCNSGDTDLDGVDKDRVVGYNAIAIERTESDDFSFSLSDSDKRSLLTLARNSIDAALNGRKYHPDNLPEVANTKCGAFVTLTIDGRLRGCIGHIGDDIPLGVVVNEMAEAAAMDDPRFPQLTRAEFPEIKIEVSVLTPLQRIKSIDDFELHRDGLLIRKGYRSGTFLPQVADEVNWTKDEFFGHCSQDKAGLGWDGWRNADLFTYRAIVFSE